MPSDVTHLCSKVSRVSNVCEQNGFQDSFRDFTTRVLPNEATYLANDVIWATDERKVVVGV